MSVAPIGVIHGRFQPLHLGHMEYLLEGKKRCDFLWIGITNPDPEVTAENVANPARSMPSSNPFTFFERLLMIRDALLEAGLVRKEFEIVPFPINFPEIIRYYAPLDAVYFVTVYDAWGQAKVDTLKGLGLKVDVMWTRKMSDRFTSGTEIRKLIARGNPWDHLVPASVAKIIRTFDLDRRILELASGGR